LTTLSQRERDGRKECAHLRHGINESEGSLQSLSPTEMSRERVVEILMIAEKKMGEGVRRIT